MSAVETVKKWIMKYTVRGGVVVLNTVIKGTSTIEEYKQVKEKMETLVKEFSEKHMTEVGDWTHGEPVKTWWGIDGDLCIEYEDGYCCSYNEEYLK